jgi:hypothetical protein
MSEISVNTVWTYETPLALRKPADMPGQIIDAWATNQIASIDPKMIPGWAALLVSEENFLAKLANPAAEHYVGYLDPSKVTRKGRSAAFATRRHGTRLKASYQVLVDAVADFLEVNRDAFEQRLLDTRQKYRDGDVLPNAATGDYIEHMLGAAVRQTFFLDASVKFGQYRWSSDAVRGELPPPTPFMQGPKLQDGARRLERLLIRGGCRLLSGEDLDTVHDDLDIVLRDVLDYDYAPPPVSTIRLGTETGMPLMTTTLKGSVGAEGLYPHRPPLAPDIHLVIAATTPIPGFDTLRSWAEVIIPDIQHFPRYDGRYEYQLFILFTDTPETASMVSRSEATLIPSGYGTSDTTLTFGASSVINFTTQAGLGWTTGEGPHPIQRHLFMRPLVPDIGHMFLYCQDYYESSPGIWTAVCNVQVAVGTGTYSAWEIFLLDDGHVLSTAGVIAVGETRVYRGRYIIQDNYPSECNQQLTITVTGV